MVWELNASATASNVNGGGFNPSNAGMLTDLTTDANTANTNSPIASSASYNFAAGDVNHWLYIKSGTSWTPGWYQILSVASNKATLAGTIGTAVQTDSTIGYPTPKYKANTVAGCATVGTPTSGTFSIDYSQSTAAKVNGITDFNAVGASTTLTSATAGFTPVMVGNIFHQTTTGTGAFGVVGWYEIATYVNATTVTLDRTPNSGTASVNTTGYVGGAMSMNSTLDDALFENFAGTNGTGGMHVFVKNGTYSLGQSISVGTGAGGTLAPVILEGYNTLRSDAPTGTNRPIFSTAATSLINGIYFDYYYIQTTGTASSVFTAGTGSKYFSCKHSNTSTAVGRIAFAGGGSTFLMNTELISYRGIALNSGANTITLWGCYIHDSDTGLSQASTGAVWDIFYSIISDNVTSGIATTVAVTGGINIINSTLYGAENKLGIGLSLTSGTSAVRVINSILYGFVTGWNAGAAETVMVSMYNDYSNNTTDLTNVVKGQGDIALAPGFTNVTQITGTGASSSTNVLTVGSGTPFGSITDNVDFVYLSAGSGTGIALNKYLITSHTTTTLTVSSNITSSGAGSAIAWQVTLGRNFTPGTNMSAVGWPGTIDVLGYSGYPDIGAIQRQPTGSETSTGRFN